MSSRPHLSSSPLSDSTLPDMKLHDRYETVLNPLNFVTIVRTQSWHEADQTEYPSITINGSIRLFYTDKANADSDMNRITDRIVGGFRE